MKKMRLMGILGVMLAASAMVRGQDYSMISIPFVGTNDIWFTPPWWTTSATNASGIAPWQAWEAANTNSARLKGEADFATGMGTNAQEPNLVHQSARMVLFTTNVLYITTNGMPIGVVATNGFAGADGTPFNGAINVCYDIGTHGTNLVQTLTNAPVALRLNMAIATPGASVYGISNVVIWTWTAPQFFDRTNTTFSQHFEVSDPSNVGQYPHDAAPAQWALTNMARLDAATIKQWATNPAVAPIYAAAEPVELDSGVTLAPSRANTNYVCVNLTEGGNLLAQWRQTNHWARVRYIYTGTWTDTGNQDSSGHEIWTGVGNSPVVVGVDSNGVTGPVSVEVSENIRQPVWTRPASVTSSYPYATNCYVLSWPATADHAYVKATAAGTVAFQVYGDIVTSRLIGALVMATNSTPASTTTKAWYVLTNSDGSTWAIPAAKWP